MPDSQGTAYHARMRLRDILAFPALYKLHNLLIDAVGSRRRLVNNYIRPEPGFLIVDIGCGTADILEELPRDIRYTGFDASERYIENCRKRYGDRGGFHCVKVEDMHKTGVQADVVLAIGLLHHLDDAQADSLFQLAWALLKPGGRLVTLDGAYVPGQNPIARWMLDHDRGEFVREPAAYQMLALQTFPKVLADIRHDMLRIPYTHIIMQCVKE